MTVSDSIEGQQNRGASAKYHTTHETQTSNHATKQMLVRALRGLGILPKGLAKPVVGPKAYVRWWQRLRSLVVLVAIVVGLGVAVAIVVGVVVVGLAFLLENAIS